MNATCNEPIDLEEVRDLEGWSETAPWTPGQELLLRASGGAHLRDDLRVSIAQQQYSASVEGDRKAVVKGDQSLEVRFNMITNIAGKDSLTVNGPAHIEAHERVTLGVGTMTRRWKGPMVRLIGMEGVIAGGVFTKTYMGASISMSPLATGDVYGAAIHGSLVRIYLSATLGYRSVERAMWGGALQVRNTALTIEPAVQTPMMDKPRHWALKAGRIGLAVCPLADILFGVLTAPVMIAAAIYGIVKNWKKPPQPPAGPPRVHNRTVGAWTQSRASDKNL